MSTSEQKIGLIPRLWVQGKWGPQDWALVVTNQRTILVLEKSSKAGLGGALGGAIGAAIAAAASNKRQAFDYANIDLQTLASDDHNKTIPHDALLQIKMHKKRIGNAYELEIEYRNQEGKTKNIKGALLPPDIVLQQRKEQGTDKGQIFLDYAKNVINVFQNALSPTRLSSLMPAAPF
jgi:hypothetical protein